MLPSIVLLDFEKVFLSMGADLDDVLRLDMLLNLLPVAAVLLECVKKRLMFMRGPVFTMLRDDVRLSRLLHGKGVASEGACCGGRGGWA